MNQRYTGSIITILVGAAILTLFPVQGSSPAGFDAGVFQEKVPNIIVDIPRDSIRPLNEPLYESAVTASTWLDDTALVLGVSFGTDARAYPIRIMNWHQIVNDHVGNHEILVTYSPLSGSAIVFDRHIREKVHTFGNTGSVYESTMVMYDRETDTYWQQTSGLALEGVLKDTQLVTLPSSLVRFGDWRVLHPDTEVLSVPIGPNRPYHIELHEDPNSRPTFSVSVLDDRLPPKELVLGVLQEHMFRAYPLQKLAGQTVQDVLGSTTLEVIVADDGSGASAFTVNGDGSRQAATTATMYWFAWVLAHPGTDLFEFLP